MWIPSRDSLMRQRSPSCRRFSRRIFPGTWRVVSMPARCRNTKDSYRLFEIKYASFVVLAVSQLAQDSRKRNSWPPHPLRRPDQPFWGRQFIGGKKGAHTGWKYGGGSGPSQMSLSLVPPSLIGTLPRPDGVFQ
jgi:hypothetical protein